MLIYIRKIFIDYIFEKVDKNNIKNYKALSENLIKNSSCLLS
jgi:hypothetical protein